VRAGIEQHALQRQSLLGLLIGPLGNRHPGAVKALGELVADQLEVAEVEHPGLGVHGLRLIEAAHRVSGHEGVGELSLQPSDLSPQRAPGGPLFGSVAVPGQVELGIHGRPRWSVIQLVG
jgi:hypothetical protein